MIESAGEPGQVEGKPMALRPVCRPAHRSLVLALVAALVAGLGVMVSAAPSAAASGSGGLYTPLTPTRILDTRQGIGAPQAPVAPRTSLHLHVLGHAGIPAYGVSAVAVTVTVPAVGHGGHISVYPTGGDPPTTSNLTFTPGVTTATSAIVGLGGDAIDLYNGSSGSIHLVVDVAGYYSDGAATAPGAFNPTTPTRVLDTRSGVGAPKAAVPARRSLVLQVAGRGGVPARGAGSVAVTITTTAPTGNGHITAYADGAARPNTSTLNFRAGSTTTNLAVVQMGADGRVALYNGSSGQVQLIVDIAGFYRAGTVTAPGGFVPVVPERVLDTRIGLGSPTGPLGPRTNLDLHVMGAGGIPGAGVGAAVLNVTVVHPASSGYLDLAPTTSFLNFRPDDTKADLVLAKLAGDGTTSITNVSVGGTDVVADVVGYYPTAPSVAALSAATGTMSGGEHVTLSGIGFTPDSEVMFGDLRAATSVFTGPGTLTVTAPAHAAGLVDVTVTSRYGTSATGTADQYYYLAPKHSLRWSPETTIDPPAGHLASVSCPTSTFCAALDVYGAVTEFDGSKWGTTTAVAALSSHGRAVSCPSAGACVAASGDGHFAVLQNGSWLDAPGLPDVQTSMLTCPSLTFCVAAQGNGGTVYMFDGSAWTGPIDVDRAAGIFAVSCASESFCVAVDGSGNAMTFDGDIWHEPVSIDAGQLLRFVSCTSPTFCLAIDDYASDPTVLRYDGTSWTRSTLVDGARARAFSCASPTFCMVIDTSARALIFDGTSSSTPVSTPVGWYIGATPGLSCGSAGLCVAVGAAWLAAVFTGHGWSSAVVDPPRGHLSSISCVGSDFCAAADFYGNVLTTDGTTWSGLVDTGVHVFGPNAISCVSQTFCLLVDGGKAALYDGTGWRMLGPTNLYGEDGVSCATAAHCVAVDSAGRASVFDGSSWTSPVAIRPGSSGNLPSVSCPLTTFCAVLFYDGVLDVLKDGKWAQAAVHVQHATDLSCTSATFCVAIGAAGTVSTYDGATWSSPAMLDPNSTRVACSSSTRCVIAGADSSVWDGSAWSAPVPVPDTPSGPISCASDSWCMALTDSGARTVTDP